MITQETMTKVFDAMTQEALAAFAVAAYRTDNALMARWAEYVGNKNFGEKPWAQLMQDAWDEA